MSDAALRELERRWRLSGSEADLARWLEARSRAGLVPRERLELAAWMGHAGALKALGGEAPAPRWEAWAFGLDVAAARVFLVDASCELKELLAHHELEEDPEGEDATTVLRALEEALVHLGPTIPLEVTTDLLGLAEQVLSVHDSGRDVLRSLRAAVHVPLPTTLVVTALHAVATSRRAEVRRALLAWATGLG